MSIRLSFAGLEHSPSFESWLRGQGVLSHDVLRAAECDRIEYCYSRADAVVCCPFCGVDFGNVANLFEHLVVTRPEAFTSSGYRVYRDLGVCEKESQTKISRPCSATRRRSRRGLAIVEVFNHSYVSTCVSSTPTELVGGGTLEPSVPDEDVGAYIEDVSASTSSPPPAQRPRPSPRRESDSSCSSSILDESFDSAGMRVSDPSHFVCGWFVPYLILVLSFRLQSFVGSQMCVVKVLAHRLCSPHMI